ncbi:siderophore-interacting protein [Microtetraspora malaysiensis]|uniref:siderophore-interacting protein n=1 Tax=Microtetraspora malaysiensis TaxID=161358 RepID=UPI00082D5801|nr:siderophore-interacting protein [Microtetraspora malaysiensis]
MTVAYRPFRLHVARTERLSPTFVRVTFAGEELSGFGHDGYDQRVKVVVPLPDAGLDAFPTGPDWFPIWRDLPEDRKNPIRTYTVRALREAPGRHRELDVDFALHGPVGVASRWAAQARPGSPVVIVGPDARYSGPPVGVEWAPPAGATRLLLVGDETAVPAVSAIAETLGDSAAVRVLLEVPGPGDVLDLRVTPNVEVTWLPRGTAPHGELLIPAVRDAVRELGVAAGGPERGEESGDGPGDESPERLWDVPERASGGFYAWLAGEMGVVRELRRHLVRELGVDRSCVAFMGYWRQGAPEHD